ncbi:MAG: tRNA glutamyl-Q(34) synthetase GluQRS [Gammaproteobacteria bacterium]|nr:tRNA glutamyl-Q(34) synthetase GluQRS [Gammaproteobacteria bacterium]
MTRAGAGRFAPSPTGHLHLGSLLAATASYLDARSQGMAWQVRLDDLDEPRSEPGADRAILQALECHGLYWDGPVIRQSDHGERYAAALDALAAAGHLFYCRCSRKDLRDAAIYPGTCREHRSPRPDCAIRVRVGEATVEFDDLLLGPQRVVLARDTGDFVVRRRDGLTAYQLATAVDDGDPAITRVIRGRDLLDSTPRQIYLMRQLGLSIPRYGHIRVLLNAHGQKLSKSTRAAALDLSRPADNVARVLSLLGHTAPPDEADPHAMLTRAAPDFELQRIPREDAVVAAAS